MRYLTGFDCIGKVQGEGLNTFPVAATTTIVKGDAIFSSSGYAVTGTAFSTLFLGIAAESVDNSTGVAGDLNVQVTSPVAGLKFSVPVEADELIDQGDVGKLVDLQSADGIDLADATVVGYGFQILDFDASTEAVAVATYGYAIGRFVSCNIA